MKTSRIIAKRTIAAALVAFLLGTSLAGCGAGGAIDDVLNPPPKLQGLTVRCDPTSAVPLFSVDIAGMGTTTNQVVNLTPGQERFVPLAAGVYQMTTWWTINGFYMLDNTPHHFTVPVEQVAHVTVK